MFAVGPILASGARLVRERPALVATWCAAYLAVSAPVGIVARRAMTAQFAAPAITPPSETSTAHLTVLGANFVLILTAFVWFVAVLRAELRPEASRFAYLRLGWDELRIIGLSVAIWLCALVPMVAFIIVAAILIFIGGAIFGQNPPAKFIVSTVILLAFAAAAAWAYTRISLAPALTVLRRRIAIGEAWRLTKGRVWPLLAVYLIIGVAIFVLTTLTVALTQGDYWRALVSHPTDQVANQLALRAEMTKPVSLAKLILTSLLGTAMTAFYTVFGAASAATATRELLALEPEPAAPGPWDE